MICTAAFSTLIPPRPESINPIGSSFSLFCSIFVSLFCFYDNFSRYYLLLYDAYELFRSYAALAILQTFRIRRFALQIATSSCLTGIKNKSAIIQV